jgi:hypothetical protein
MPLRGSNSNSPHFCIPAYNQVAALSICVLHFSKHLVDACLTFGRDWILASTSRHLLKRDYRVKTLQTCSTFLSYYFQHFKTLILFLTCSDDAFGARYRQAEDSALPPASAWSVKEAHTTTTGRWGVKSRLFHV